MYIKLCTPKLTTPNHLDTGSKWKTLTQTATRTVIWWNQWRKISGFFLKTINTVSCKTKSQMFNLVDPWKTWTFQRLLKSDILITYAELNYFRPHKEPAVKCAAFIEVLPENTQLDSYGCKLLVNSGTKISSHLTQTDRNNPCSVLKTCTSSGTVRINDQIEKMASAPFHQIRTDFRSYGFRFSIHFRPTKMKIK